MPSAAAPTAPCISKQRERDSRWTVPIPGNVHTRTDVEKALAAARVRAGKARRHTAKISSMPKEAVQKALVTLRSAGVLRDSGKTTVKTTGITITSSGAASFLPVEAMQHISYSTLPGRSSLVKAFGVDKKTVSSVICLSAHCHGKGIGAALGAHGDVIKNRGAAAFVSSLSSDATSDTLNLPMLGAEDPEAQHCSRSVWHVLASLQWFGWSLKPVQPQPDDDDDGERLLDWNRYELVRKPVPITSSESGETIYEGLYTLPANQSCTTFELVGISNARFGMLHFDIDGHGANMRSISCRRDKVRTPLIKQIYKTKKQQ